MLVTEGGDDGYYVMLDVYIALELCDPLCINHPFTANQCGPKSRLASLLFTPQVGCGVWVWCVCAVWVRCGVCSVYVRCISF